VKKHIQYPYLPAGREILYVPESHAFMRALKRYAEKHSLDKTMPCASMVVKNLTVFGLGANGSEYHDKYGCKRKLTNSKTGENYSDCEGCHPKNHSEIKALKATLTNGNKTEGADLYLWGHWWFCKSCWDAMEKAGIENVYLMEGSEVLFNKYEKGNVVGKQFK